MKTFNEFKENTNFAEEEEDDEKRFLIDLRNDLLNMEVDLNYELDTINLDPDFSFNRDVLYQRIPKFKIMDEIGEISYRAGKIANFLQFVKGK